MINKFVSSGAHLSNKQLISCEEMTNTGQIFSTTLERIKVTGDQSNLSGVTHSVLHGFNYSPLETPFPGWIRYGSFLNERNNEWPYFRLWSDYKARLSCVLQNSVMQAGYCSKSVCSRWPILLLNLVSRETRSRVLCILRMCTISGRPFIKMAMAAIMFLNIFCSSRPSLRAN